VVVGAPLFRFRWWRDVRAHLDKALAQFSWFTPVAVTVFGGKCDPAKLGFPWSLIPPVKRIPPSDIRDWDRITRWAEALVAALQLGEA
jgi:menaquinone-dependent protoporphyrinogen IX oxidase